MKQKSENSNSVWEEIRYRIVCDRWGDCVTTTTFSSAHQFRIDPHIDYQFLSEDEVEEMRRQEDEATREMEKERAKALSLIFELVEKHFTPTQQYVFSGYLAGKSWTQMAEERNCSEAAIRQVFYGNSLGQGGVIRKLRKLLEGKNYFERG